MKLYMTQIDPPDPHLVRDLAARGWQTRHLAFREVVYPEVSIDPSAWDLWIITSKKAARLVRDRADLPRLAVVGEATAAHLPRERLWFSEAPASAEALCSRLKGTLPRGTRVCFLCGDKARPLAPFMGGSESTGR